MEDSSLDMSISSHVLEIIRCAICLDMPEEPKLLQCAHVFCLACLEGHLAASSGRFLARRLVCPECRQVSHLPPSGLKHLPTDYRALQLGELIETRRKAKAAKKKDIEHKLNISMESTMSHESTLEPELVTNLATKLHTLLRFNVREAKTLLEERSREERAVIVAEQVGSNTALTLAIESVSPETVLYLIEQCGADVEQRCEGIISNEGQRTITRSPPIVKAVHSKNLAIVEALLAHGAHVNAQDTEGWSPLHLASRKADISIVRCLVDAGADANLQDQLEITCLMNAKKRPEIRAYLLEHGADPNLRNVNGGTAICYAVSEGCEQSVRELLDHGADTTVRYPDDNTVLHAAVQEGHEEIVQLLLDRGVDPYAKNSRNEDCFLLATLLDRYLILKCLLRKHKASFYN